MPMVDLLRFLLPGGETTGAAAAADPAAGYLLLLALLFLLLTSPLPGFRPPGFHMCDVVWSVIVVVRVAWVLLASR
jgi:hypothetical protein